ncbi:MAG: hypothetical protein AAGM38_07375 [Pseudomonadota bacterium]
MPVPRPASFAAEPIAATSAAARTLSEAERQASGVGAAAGAEPDVDIIVLGVLLGGADERALVRTPDGENRRVSRGDVIAGWSVSAIGEDFVRLRRASQTRELKVPQ